MAVPTNISFAEEVKADRLRTLATLTGLLCGVGLVILLFIGSLVPEANLSPGFLVGLVLLLLGCVGTRMLLGQDALQRASWLYVLSAVVTASCLLIRPTAEALEIVPFIFPIIIFIGGLMISPVGLAYLSALCVSIIFFLPMLTSGSISLTAHPLVAIVLIILSATLAAQVTGELYQITQWALFNYQRERRTNDELFQKREALQKSLRRSQALASKLSETNQELALAHAEAEEAKHFRGQFLANMSHELRTPLNAIIGFSETMLEYPILYDGATLPDAYKSDMEQIYGSGQQLLGVINDILDLARVDAGKLEIYMQPVVLHDIIDSVEATTRGLIGQKPVELQKVLVDPLPKVWVDSKRLRQVLLNIYSNAAKYTDEGVIELTIRELPEQEEVEFALRDTGVGIAPEFHDVLFEEFEQAVLAGRDPRAGAGLGLAITKQLLGLMGGRIWLESAVGEGSTFYFTVQAYNGQAPSVVGEQVSRQIDTKKLPRYLDANVSAVEG